MPGTPNTDHHDVAIVGAGLAGLGPGRRPPARPRLPGAAHRLPRAAPPPGPRRPRPAPVRPGCARAGRRSLPPGGRPVPLPRRRAARCVRTRGLARGQAAGRPAAPERFFEPLVGGIQLDPALGTSRRVFDVVLRSLARGDSAVPAVGMEEIPRQLAAGLPAGTLRCDSRVGRVDDGCVTLDDGEVVTATHVVVATEGPATDRPATWP